MLRVFTFLVIFSSLSISNLFSQIQEVKKENMISFSYGYPSIKENFLIKKFDFFSGSYNLTGKYAFDENWSMNANLPFFNFSKDNQSENGIGNISLGGEYQTKLIGPFRAGARVYLNTMDDNDFLIGGFAIVPEYFNFGSFVTATSLELYAEKLFTSGNMYYGADLGNIMSFPKEDNADMEDFVRLGIKVGYDKMNSIGGEIKYGGFFHLTDDGANENFNIHFLKLTGNYRLLNVNPKVFVTLPLNENYSDIIEFVVGLGIDISL